MSASQEQEGQGRDSCAVRDESAIDAAGEILFYIIMGNFIYLICKIHIMDNVCEI
jgi:hypothetical protein